MMPELYFERYTSQMRVIGKRGQQKLAKTRVHIAGFGGLGNLLALFLSTAGIGYISANDPQRLGRENLGRFVCGEEADIGRHKVVTAARFFHRNPYVAFEPVIGKNESNSISLLYERADWIFSCGNTVPARLAAARKAIELRKPIIDLGVSDGRRNLEGNIKYWLPECADWSACPACYLDSKSEISRNEGLLITVLAGTSALAANIFVSLVTGCDAEFTKTQNYLAIEMGTYQIETLAVLKRRRCSLCSKCASQ